MLYSARWSDEGASGKHATETWLQNKALMLIEDIFKYMILTFRK